MTAPVIHSFRAELWLWDARRQDSWIFVSLPPEVAEEIREQAPPAAGFGSVRVVARIGATTWRTSIFPDAARDTFVLPVKKAVRRAEGLAEGDVAPVQLEVGDV
ncbi:DUF1905 domain-containing protein [Pseudonocardia yuanmonensis]|uniref:DUF1905 domain-containing protein n=1 Tax=Pseudonocardia yuanmonensis TaxID=1095914 RepID=A0ABP8WC27_9PSEU